MRRKTKALGVFALVIAGAMAGSAMTVWAAAFTDVLPGHPFYDDIEWVAANGIANGYSDGTFRPSDPVTRQSMAAFLHRLSDKGITTHQVTASDTAPSLGMKGVMARCAAGEVVGGGGYEMATISQVVQPLTNAPLQVDGIEGWQVTITNDSGAAVAFDAYAICTAGESTGF